MRTVEMPLFPGYIFGRFSPADRVQIQRGAGVAGIVGAGGVDHPITDGEMASVLSLVHSREEVFKSPFLQVGTRVRVCGGPLVGMVGILQHVKTSYRLVISIELLQRSVAVEVDMALVEPLAQAPRRLEFAQVALAGRAG